MNAKPSVRRQISELDIKVTASNKPDITLMPYVAEMLLRPEDLRSMCYMQNYRNQDKQNCKKGFLC